MEFKEIDQHPVVRIITYVGIVFFTVLATKAYLGYLTVQQAIENNQNAIQTTNDKISYYTNYRLPYLQSEYASYFVVHENNMPHSYEQIVRVVHAIPADETVGAGYPLPEGVSMRTGAGRYDYFQYKLKKAKIR